MIERVKSYPILNQLSNEERLSLLPFLTEISFAKGSTILRKGEVSERIYILISGKAHIYLDEQSKVQIAVLESGHLFGEMSSLTGEPVSAYVVAEEDIVALTVERQGIFLMMDRSTPFRNHMIEMLMNRIRRSNDRVVEEHQSRTILAQELDAEGRMKYGELIGESEEILRLRNVIEQVAPLKEPICIYGEDGVGKYHVANLIHYGSQNEVILTMSGDNFELDEWEHKVAAAKNGTVVIRHAELLPKEIIHTMLHSYKDARLVFTANKPMELILYQIEIVPLRDRSEDVQQLVYYFLAKAGASKPEDAISQESLSMLTLYPFLAGNIEELRKVVEDAYIVSEGKTIRNQHLRFGRHRKAGTRPTIGLALGSGAARGAAHVGVLKVLEEENIPIDFIAGTSVGAFMGALYAGGVPIAEFESVLPTVRWSQLVRPIVPYQAFTDNHPMSRFIEKYIGPKQIEQLDIPFAAVASDAHTGEAHIIRTGLVANAVRASAAIPGVMRPVQHQGKTLVDGAVVHPVPAALVKSMGADIVIAVDIGMPSFEKGVAKNFISSILQTIDIMSVKIVKEELQLADVVIKPHFEENYKNFKHSSIYIQSGFTAAHESIASIKEKLINSATYFSVS